jgi:E3 ubiquitin-protein ligase SIAH1
MHHCPTCRQQFLNTRNLALEDLARQVMYPCKYRSYGCTGTCSHDNIAGHQAKCVYSPQVCPVAKLGNGNCSWTGRYNDIKGHLKANHLEICCEYTEDGIQVLYRLTDDMMCFGFIFAHNEIFFTTVLENENTLHVVVHYIGPAENAAKYKYKVEFVNKDKTEGVTLMYLTRSAGENLRDIYRSGNCGKLHYDVVFRLADEESKVKLKLEIIRIGN